MVHGNMVGGKVNFISSKEILIYDGNLDYWTKTGELCHARAEHAMSLVSADFEVEDVCILDPDCFY